MAILHGVARQFATRLPILVLLLLSAAWLIVIDDVSDEQAAVPKQNLSGSAWTATAFAAPAPRHRDDPGIIGIAVDTDYPAGFYNDTALGRQQSDNAQRIDDTLFPDDQSGFPSRFLPGIDITSRIVTAGIGEQGALSGHQRQRATSTYIWGGAGLLLLVGVIGLLLLQTYRLRRCVSAAREAQATFRAAAESSLGAFVILKCQRGAGNRVEDFVLADVNQHAAESIGLPKEQIVGRKICELLPARRTDGFFGKCVKVVESGIPLDEEFENVSDANGAEWLQHRIVPISDGVAVTTRNISERKRAEMRLRSNRAFFQSLIDYLPVLIYASRLRPESFGRVVVWNKAAQAVTGYSTQDVIDKSGQESLPPEVAAIFSSVNEKMLVSPAVRSFPELPFRRADGGLRYLRLIAVPLFDQDDQPEYVLGIAEDITARREQELELRRKQAELAAANDASPLGLFRTDPDGACTYVNRTYEEMSGLTKEQAMKNGWAQSIHPEDRLKVFQGWGKSSRTRQQYHDVYRFRHDDGRIVWASVKASPIIVDGRIEGYVGSVDDITARREAEQALRESEARLRTITDTLPAMVAYVDANVRYRFNNLAYERACGHHREFIRGRHVRDIVGDAVYRRIEPYVRQALAGETVVFDLEEEGDGIYECQEVTYIPQLADDGKQVVGFHVMTHDITTKKLEERRLVQLAQLDSLTGLVNRAGFQQKLSDAMAHCKATGTLMAVMYMDLDHFKQINDMNGHHVGDELLKNLAERLSQTMRSTDTVARLGGDEFTIIMEELAKPEDAVTVAAKIVQAMRPPFILEGKPACITVSVGLAFYQGEHLDSTTLVRRADEMLYRAKQAGRNIYCAEPLH